MEEILASIRRAIDEDAGADERGTGRLETRRDNVAKEDDSTRHASPDVMTLSRTAAAAEDSINTRSGHSGGVVTSMTPRQDPMLRGTMSEVGGPDRVPEAGHSLRPKGTGKLQEKDAMAERDIDTSSRPKEPDPAQADRLVSEETENAVNAAFDRLAPAMTSKGGRSQTLEDVVKEIMRPAIRKWLDDNLPTIVERMVGEEIERLARRRPR